MKVFRNKNTETILFVDGDRWKTNTMSRWYKIDWNNSNQSFINEILEDRHPTIWLKMSINHYYNICK